MINIRKAITSIAAAVLAFAAVSCQKDDTLYYHNITMGNIVDGRFVSDQGNIFNVVEQICSGKLEDEERAMVLCDVLRQTEGTSKEYDVRLTSFSKVLAKDAVALSGTLENAELSVQDPIHVDQLWYSGGYLNLFIKFFVHQDSKQKHLINLVFSKDEEGRYVMNLRHNGYGEVYDKEKPSEMKLAGGYVSFPIIKFIEKDEAKLVLNWKWYNSPGTGYDLTTEKEYSFEYDWKRTGYEQVPKGISMKSSGEIL